MKHKQRNTGEREEQYMRRKRNVWKVIFSVGLLLNLIILAGCILESDESFAKRTLEKKYGEEFVIHNAMRRGKNMDTTASPKSDSSIVFRTYIPTSEPCKTTTYRRAYGNKLVKEYLEKDIKELFPDSYIYVDVPDIVIDPDVEFRGQDIHEFMSNIHWNMTGNNANHLKIKIFYTGNYENEEQYEKEYEFFSKQIDGYVEEGLLPQLCLVLYKVPKEIKDGLEEYMKTHSYWDNYSSSTELEKNEFIAHFYDLDECDITYITEEEYIEGREKLDNE